MRVAILSAVTSPVLLVLLVTSGCSGDDPAEKSSGGTGTPEVESMGEWTARPLPSTSDALTTTLKSSLNDREAAKLPFSKECWDGEGGRIFLDLKKWTEKRLKMSGGFTGDGSKGYVHMRDDETSTHYFFLAEKTAEGWQVIGVAKSEEEAKKHTAG